MSIAETQPLPLNQPQDHVLNPVVSGIIRPVKKPISLDRFFAGVFFGTAALGLITFADLATGPTVFLGPMYIAGVIVGTWVGGRWSGHVLSVITTAAWFVVYMIEHARFMPLTVSADILNMVLRLIFYGMAVELLGWLKVIELRLQRVVTERTAELRQEVIERQRAEASLRQLAGQMAAAEDAERRRIAYDIHDALSQMLGLVKINLETTVAETAIDSRQYTRLNDVVKTVDQLISQTRNLTFELHPSMLDHFGIGPTVKRFAEEYGRQTMCRISVVEVGMPESLSTALASYLFRAVKEMISNSMRHGNAREVIVTFHWTRHQLRIVIDDDGCGFDVEKVKKFVPGSRRGLGLAGIEERLSSLGGRLVIESTIGAGARAIMEVPLPYGIENPVINTKS